MRLIDQDLPAGVHQALWQDAGGLASGVYFVVGRGATRFRERLVLLK